MTKSIDPDAELKNILSFLDQSRVEILAGREFRRQLSEYVRGQLAAISRRAVNDEPSSPEDKAILRVLGEIIAMISQYAEKVDSIPSEEDHGNGEPTTK